MRRLSISCAALALLAVSPAGAQTAADREAHEKMGFHEGWGIATDQLATLAART